MAFSLSLFTSLSGKPGFFQSLLLSQEGFNYSLPLHFLQTRIFLLDQCRLFQEGGGEQGKGLFNNHHIFSGKKTSTFFLESHVCAEANIDLQPTYYIAASTPPYRKCVIWPGEEEGKK